MLNNINPKTAAADELNLAPLDSGTPLQQQQQHYQAAAPPQREEGRQQQWPVPPPPSAFHAPGFHLLHIFFALVAGATAGVAAAYLVDSLDYEAVGYYRPVTITACFFACLADSWAIRLNRRRSPSLPAVALVLDSITLVAAALSLVFQSGAARYRLSRLGLPWLAMTATMMGTRVVSIGVTVVLACTTVKQWKRQQGLVLDLFHTAPAPAILKVVP
ncbi:hypothetical protein SCUCBS95973_009484 [Sporothrix curviconia]|uniref:Integral membrane protein n=1 Tax=Sporothrix curviconia TaxID=1260050 RepID=A0ABP0CVA8_9PEZI